ncbi:atherin-like [Sorghum bicolor]|uniref:atherin-like n=1 Tax=Sorghum bicolor TaxID=4558 RepID=UPI000B424C72|nr:atherin-like [Sorghum bicolor]|eukprot:XP_021320583.1 atherin-like [Sorghum bicolor]
MLPPVSRVPPGHARRVSSPSLLLGPAARAAPPTSHGRGSPRPPATLTAGPRDSGPDKVPKARERAGGTPARREREKRERERGRRRREKPLVSRLQPPRLPFPLAASASPRGARKESPKGFAPADGGAGAFACGGLRDLAAAPPAGVSGSSGGRAAGGACGAR